MAAKGPTRLVMRVYSVGFGDCFLLEFHYGRTKRRHVLVDFGSTELPPGAPKDRLTAIALDVKERCRGKLHAVVATHRHQDHVSGFATNDDGTGPGDVIRSLDPDVVVQPWTENPALEEDATSSPVVVEDARRAFAARLTAMQGVAAAALRAARDLAATDPRAARRLAFLGEDNVKNLSAVRNLQAMGRKRRAAWVHHGSASGLEDVLPGVRVRVLGPPTLEQSDSIRAQRRHDDDEFWHLAARTAGGVAAPDAGPQERLFPSASVVEPGKEPVSARWLMARIREAWAESMLGIVTALDRQMNNTSVILLLEAGRTRLLLSGDAQIENWEYALSRPGAAETLGDVRVLKVGHHGSLNATPRSLWKLLRRRKDAAGARDLLSVVSTLEDVHGSKGNRSEVPRTTLMAALRRGSDLFTTQSLRPDEIARDVEIPLR